MATRAVQRYGLRDVAARVRLLSSGRRWHGSCCGSSLKWNETPSISTLGQGILLREEEGLWDRGLGFMCEQRRSLRLLAKSEAERERRQQADRIVVYRGKWMRPFRLVVRLKLVQLAGVGALVIPLAHLSQHGSLPLPALLACGGVLIGSASASGALWYYSRRYVGEMSLTPDMKRVQISVMDFWGNRKDVEVDVRDVIPPLQGLDKEELQAVANHVLTPLNVAGERQFVLSLKHGQLVHKEKLFQLLHGKLSGDEQEEDVVESSG